MTSAFAAIGDQNDELPPVRNAQSIYSGHEKVTLC